MKKQIFLATLVFTVIASGMEEAAKQEVVVEFTDHLALPNGHIRAIYEPLTKQIGIERFKVNNSKEVSYHHLNLENTSSIFEKIKLNLFCGIVPYNQYIFYGLIGTQDAPKDCIVVGRQNMITNDTFFAYTEKLDPNLAAIYSLKSLIFSPKRIAAEIIALNKSGTIEIGRIDLGNAFLNSVSQSQK